MLAPSHTRVNRIASRRSGGVVTTTYAAATPATPMTMLAAVRAPDFVIGVQLRREPPVGEPPVPLLPVDPLPRVCSDEPLRIVSEPVPYADDEEP
jgi:hypothetical protein